MSTNKLLATVLNSEIEDFVFYSIGYGAYIFWSDRDHPLLYAAFSSGFKALPHEWSMKVWEGIGQVQVVLEDHRKVLRLEPEKGCISLFRLLTVNFWP